MHGHPHSAAKDGVYTYERSFTAKEVLNALLTVYQPKIPKINQEPAIIACYRDERDSNREHSVELTRLVITNYWKENELT